MQAMAKREKTTLAMPMESLVETVKKPEFSDYPQLLLAVLEYVSMKSFLRCFDYDLCPRPYC